MYSKSSVGSTVGWDDLAVWLKFVTQWTWADYDLAIGDVRAWRGDRECPISWVFNLLCVPVVPPITCFSIYSTVSISSRRTSPSC